jgi:hypothetical protein
VHPSPVSPADPAGPASTPGVPEILATNLLGNSPIARELFPVDERAAGALPVSRRGQQNGSEDVGPMTAYVSCRTGARPLGSSLPSCLPIASGRAIATSSTFFG